ncbi:MAG: hypothetical protein V4568_18400 [Pseudomonadota bacterium]
MRTQYTEDYEKFVSSKLTILDEIERAVEEKLNIHIYSVKNDGPLNKFTVYKDDERLKSEDPIEKKEAEEAALKFQKFTEEYCEGVDRLIKFLEDNGVSEDIIEKAKTNISLFKKRAFDKDNTYYSGQKEILYSSVKKTLFTALNLLENENIPLDKRLEAVPELTAKLAVCQTGLLNECTSWVGALASNLLGFKGALWQLNDRILTQEAVFDVRDNSTYLPGNETHCSAYVLKQAAKELPLLSPDDFLATQGFTQIEDSQIERFVSRIKERGAIDHNVEFIGTQYIDAMRDAIKKFLESEGVENPTGFEKVKFSEKLVDAINIAKGGLVSQFGDPELGLADFMFIRDEDKGIYQLHPNATLVCSTLLSKMRGLKFIQGEPLTIAPAPKEGAKALIGEGTFFFLEDSDGNQDFLSPETLSQFSVEDIEARAKGKKFNQEEINELMQDIVRSAIKGATGEDLLQFPGAWLKHLKFTDVLEKLPNVPVHLHMQIVEKLIKETRIDKQSKNTEGLSPLLLSAKLGLIEPFKALVDYLGESGIPFTERDQRGRNAFALALHNGKEDFASVFLDYVTTQANNGSIDRDTEIDLITAPDEKGVTARFVLLTKLRSQKDLEKHDDSQTALEKYDEKITDWFLVKIITGDEYMSLMNPKDSQGRSGRFFLVAKGDALLEYDTDFMTDILNQTMIDKKLLEFKLPYWQDQLLPRDMHGSAARAIAIRDNQYEGVIRDTNCAGSLGNTLLKLAPMDDVLETYEDFFNPTIVLGNGVPVSARGFAIASGLKKMVGALNDMTIRSVLKTPVGNDIDYVVSVLECGYEIQGQRQDPRMIAAVNGYTETLKEDIALLEEVLEDGRLDDQIGFWENQLLSFPAALFHTGVSAESFAALSELTLAVLKKGFLQNDEACWTRLLLTHIRLRNGEAMPMHQYLIQNGRPGVAEVLSAVCSEALKQGVLDNNVKLLNGLFANFGAITDPAMTPSAPEATKALGDLCIAILKKGVLKNVGNQEGLQTAFSNLISRQVKTKADKPPIPISIFYAGSEQKNDLEKLKAITAVHLAIIESGFVDQKIPALRTQLGSFINAQRLGESKAVAADVLSKPVIAILHKNLLEDEKIWEQISPVTKVKSGEIELVRTLHTAFSHQAMLGIQNEVFFTVIENGVLNN